MRSALILLVLAALAHGDTSPREIAPRALVWARSASGAGQLMLLSPSSGRIRWKADVTLNQTHRYWLDTVTLPPPPTA